MLGRVDSFCGFQDLSHDGIAFGVDPNPTGRDGSLSHLSVTMRRMKDAEGKADVINVARRPPKKNKAQTREPTSVQGTKADLLIQK